MLSVTPSVDSGAVRLYHSSTAEQTENNFLCELSNLGPVVQSIVSLTSLLRGQLVKCSMTL